MTMKITLLGTGSPRPALHRFPPALVVETPAGPWLVDCGDGTLWQLLRAGIAPETVTRVIFTHLHADHVLGYGPLLFGGWSLGRQQLSVWGPAGTQRLHDLHVEFFAQDIAYRLSVVQRQGLTEVTVTEFGSGLVTSVDGVTVEAMPVIHSIETYALRFRSGDKTLVVSGDTAFCEDLIDFARGADVLVHEAALASSARRLYNRPGTWERFLQVHCTPAQAAQVARRAGVKKLVLVHLPPTAVEEEILDECRQEYDGTVVVGRDLLTVEC